jgi:hypothetical protein
MTRRSATLTLATRAIPGGMAYSDDKLKANGDNMLNLRRQPATPTVMSTNSQDEQRKSSLPSVSSREC